MIMIAQSFVCAPPIPTRFPQGLHFRQRHDRQVSASESLSALSELTSLISRGQASGYRGAGFSAELQKINF
jgi:hypothetical protein